MKSQKTRTKVSDIIHDTMQLLIFFGGLSLCMLLQAKLLSLLCPQPDQPGEPLEKFLSGPVEHALSSMPTYLKTFCRVCIYVPCIALYISGLFLASFPHIAILGPCLLLRLYDTYRTRGNYHREFRQIKQAIEWFQQKKADIILGLILLVSVAASVAEIHFFADRIAPFLANTVFVPLSHSLGQLWERFIDRPAVHSILTFFHSLYSSYPAFWNVIQWIVVSVLTVLILLAAFVLFFLLILWNAFIPMRIFHAADEFLKFVRKHAGRCMKVSPCAQS
ncbi:MAG: hypothetical protein RMJ43_00270 [Chloroherpetonaceae bacterium]|nr:hypothetical protein [Chthonomonadaceae bacterium]MDW8206243.1 hypothetical protein [Chloroherpetonaceae bacterium]